MGHSKPVSVNINTKGFNNDGLKNPSINNPNLKTNNPIGLPSRNSISQKPNTETKLSLNTASNRGIGISTSKPSSVINYSSSSSQPNSVNRYS